MKKRWMIASISLMSLGLLSVAKANVEKCPPVSGYTLHSVNITMDDTRVVCNYRTNGLPINKVFTGKISKANGNWRQYGNKYQCVSNRSSDCLYNIH